MVSFTSVNGGGTVNAHVLDVLDEHKEEEESEEVEGERSRFWRNQSERDLGHIGEVFREGEDDSERQLKPSLPQQHRHV